MSTQTPPFTVTKALDADRTRYHGECQLCPYSVLRSTRASAEHNIKMHVIYVHEVGVWPLYDGARS